MARKTNPAFAKYIRTMKLTKGKGPSCNTKAGRKARKCCDRKAALRAVKGGASPAAAVKRHCG